jgi:hypothetical protein
MATRNLRITACNEVYRGNGAKGEYVIYELEAVNADTGVLVNLPLRSFTHFNEGETGAFTVEKYERPGKPVSFTVSKPKSAGGNALGPKIDDLRRRLEVVEQNMDMMRRAIAVLEQQAPAAAAPAVGGSIHTRSGAPSLAGGGPPDDSDIPF